MKRIFVEKKEDYNVEAKVLGKEIKEYLNITNLKKVRIINVYDILNSSEEEYKEIVEKILWEENLDYSYKDKVSYKSEEKYFRVDFVTGQYNQKEDSAEQSIKIILGNEDIKVNHSKILVFEGVDSEDLKKIKKYYINPVEMKEIAMDDIVDKRYKESANEVEVLDNFINMTADEIAEMKESHGLGLDMDDLLYCQEYFKNEEKRDPTITELKVIDTYWSDHCRHTTFMTEIKDIEFEEGFYKPLIEKTFKEYIQSRDYVYGDREKAVSLMDLATINAKEIKKKGLLDDLEESEEINAASVEIDVDVDGKIEKWLLMFKNETHNHPTEIEPFGGASTCLGGCIRDPLSGRSYVYQAMRVTGSGDPRQKFEDTLPGKLPQRSITQTAMEGYSSYGYEIGSPSGYIKEIYDEGYIAKRMEVGALVAAAPRENVKRESPKSGDIILLLGGRTGRDGLGGAVGSSKKHTEESQETGGAEVQKGNPLMERRILRLFRNESVSKMIKKCNDFGAGGVSVAIGELADGLIIDLDKVPLKYPGLDGTEIALSESQERMAVVIEEKDLDKFREYTKKEDVETTLVAKVTDKNRLTMDWNGSSIVDVSRDFLDTNGMSKKTEILVGSPEKESYFHKNPEGLNEETLEENWIKNMISLNTANQKGLIEKFDHTVGKGTVLMPLGGKYKLTPVEGMVAKIPVLKGETNTCSLMSYGFDPKLSKWSTFHGGVYAVIDSLAKITAMGGDYRKARLSFQEYFERIGTDKKKWGAPFSGLLGAYVANKNLDIPGIGGKDSMSGTFEDINVPPTIISFAVTTDKVQNIISSEFKEVGSNVVLIPLDIDEEGMVDFEQVKTNYTHIKELVDEGKILSASTIKFGGIGRSISEMAFGNKIGFKLNSEVDKSQLFLPKYGSIILEVEENPESLFKDINYELLGTTIEEEYIELENEKIDLDSLINKWTEPLVDVFPIKEEVEYNPKKINYTKGEEKTSKIKDEKAKVFIPIFPGTHGEYDMEKSFQKAGAVVDSFVFRTLKGEDIDFSYKEMANRIKEANILAIPDGAVLGDEPDGGGKLIANILKNSYVKEAVMDLLNNRDGLILGIGNGFKGLMKSGLITYGEIRDLDEDSPNVTYNRSGYYVSTMVNTRIVSNLSPWFANGNIEKVNTLPLSTKEGRIVGKVEEIERLIENGQISSQYVDYDPTGSIYGIESMTSPDGRVLGKVASSDRVDGDLYKNIEIKENHNIFKAAVSYFK